MSTVIHHLHTHWIWYCVGIGSVLGGMLLLTALNAVMVVEDAKVIEIRGVNCVVQTSNGKKTIINCPYQEGDSIRVAYEKGRQYILKSAD